MPSTNQNIDNQFGGNFDPSGNENSNTGVNELGQVDLNANIGSGNNLNTNFIEGSTGGTGSYLAGETTVPDLGALDWDELQSLWNSGGLWDYTESEFGMSEDYKQYITPISQEPFDIIQAMSENKLFGANLGARKQLNTIEAQADTARNKSNLAYSGTVESAVNQSKDLLFKDYMSTVDSIGTQTKQSVFDEEQRQLERFYDDIGAVLQYGVIKDSNSDSHGNFDLDPGNDGLFCHVSVALNETGAWTKRERMTAVKWCEETHHDGTDRGKTWVKGYHTWGKFLSKWTKRSSIVKGIVKVTTTAFVDHVKNNKPNYLGSIIHNFWINPLSYIIGYSKKNKVTGSIATIGMISLYTLLFPLFGLISIPHLLKQQLKKRR